jgi:hypothetical protein
VLKLTRLGGDGTYTFKTKKTPGKLASNSFRVNFIKIDSTSENLNTITSHSNTFRVVCETKVASPPTGRPFTPRLAGDKKGWNPGTFTGLEREWRNVSWKRRISKLSHQVLKLREEL